MNQNNKYVFGSGVGYAGLGNKLFDAADALSEKQASQWHEQQISLAAVGNSCRTLSSDSLLLSSKYISERYVDEVIRRLSDNLPSIAPSTEFGWNWQKQLPAFRQTILNFFYNSDFECPIPGHIEFLPVRLAFGSCLQKKQLNMKVSEVDSHVIGCTPRGLRDERIPIGPDWTQVSLPLSGILFREAFGVKRPTAVVRQKIKRQMLLPKQRRYDYSEQVNYGCGLNTCHEQQQDGVFQPHFERANRDQSGRLLYFENYSLSFTRYLPPPEGSHVFRVQRLNWDFHPHDGKTCGVTLTLSHGLDSHVMIPGLLDWLDDTLNVVLNRSDS